jgi:hypothetical protein
MKIITFWGLLHAHGSFSQACGMREASSVLPVISKSNNTYDFSCANKVVLVLSGAY